METLITTHTHVDFDAMASVVAAQKLYAGSVIVLPQQVNINVRSFLNLNRDILPLIEPEFLAPSYKRLVVVDTRQLSRLKIVSRYINNGISLHIYDHHPNQKGDLKGELEKVESLGANTTILVEEINKKKVALTELEATLLAMGIYEDTGYLTFSSTTKRDVKAMAYLWELGINTEVLQEFLQRPLTAGQKTLFESLLSQSGFVLINQRKILFSWATSEEYIQGIAELVYRLSSVEEAEAVFSLVKMEGKVHVIARSFCEDINLLEILNFWNVRGHPSATSITLKHDSVTSARRELTEILQMNLPMPLIAADIASAPVKTVETGCQVSEAAQILAKYGHSGLVVVEGKKIVGVISRKDMQKAKKHKLEHAPVKAFMNHNAITSSKYEPVSKLRELMIANNIGRIPLTDEVGNLCGIVTRSDILRTLYRIDDLKSNLAANGMVMVGDNVDVPNNSEVYNNMENIDDLTLIINRALSPDNRKLLLLISRVAAQEKCQVYLVGGCIRDMFLGNSLPEDLDVAVIPEAISFARMLNSYLEGNLKVHDPFGTASVHLKQGMRLDLVTARKEYYQNPAALPTVEASNLKNDLFRRDFTINTLACSLNADSFGKVYDFFGGRKDLHEKTIRVLYSLSFVDDPLRILRALRFEQRFGFTIEEETMGFLLKAVKDQIIRRVSRNRLNGEIRLIFREQNPPAILKRLDELQLLDVIFPGIEVREGQWAFLEDLREGLHWAEGCDWEKKPDAELAYLALLLYERPLEEISGIGEKMNYSREKIEILKFIAERLPSIIVELKEKDIGPAKLYKLFENLSSEALLLIRTLAPTPVTRDYPQFYLEYLVDLKPELGGDDLKEMGLTPGPLYGKILDDLKKAVLDGTVRSREEERNYVMTCLEKLS